MTGRSSEEYQAALLDLFPPGPAFPRNAASVRGKLMLAIGDGLSRAEQLAHDLVVREGDPRSATFMFPDWVAMTGVEPQPTHAETLALVMARIQGLGGQSADYFVAIAAALGFTITVVKHRPRRHGAPMGPPHAGRDWAFVWDVISPLTTRHMRNHGTARMGEPYSTWGNAVLERIIRRYAPAHTLVRFIYS